MKWPWLDTRCPPNCSVTPLLSRTTGQKIRWKKPVGQDRISLIKQRPHAKLRENRDLFSASHWEAVSSHSPGSKASVCVAVVLKDKCPNNKYLPSSFLLGFIANQMSYSVECPFGQFRSAVLVCPVTSSCLAPSLLVWGACWRDSFYAVQALLSSS